jgi:hypothetical protein
LSANVNCVIFIYSFLKAKWNLVCDAFFGEGNPGARFKRPTRSQGIKNQVLKAMEVRSGRVTNPGTHSTPYDPEHHEDVSEVDKFVVKL